MENYDSNKTAGYGRKIIFFMVSVMAIGALAIGGYYLAKKGDNVPVASVSLTPTPEPAIDPSLDSDSDTIPDAVERAIRTNPEKMDTDNDSFNDLPEIKNGYSPLIAGAAGKYTTEQWQAIKDKIKAENQKFYDNNFGNGSSALIDSDSDTVPDAVEKAIGTNPDKADTDGDGFNDLAEIKSGYSPLIAGAAGKYSPEDWQAVKNKTKAADAGFYEKEFENINEIINWKTYRNEEYSFEIKYPQSPEWVVEEAQNKSIINFSPKNKVYLLEDSKVDPITITVNSGSLEDYHKVYPKSKDIEEKVLINGLSFIRQVDKQWAVVSFEIEYPKKNLSFIIISRIDALAIAMTLDASEKKLLEDNFTQMLSTFKFINQKD